MAGIADIRKWYNVPAKRGQIIRDNITHKEGVILSGKGGKYLSVRFNDDSKGKYHPFELDYLKGASQWLLGDEFKHFHDARIDARNDLWNKIESDFRKVYKEA